MEESTLPQRLVLATKAGLGAFAPAPALRNPPFFLLRRSKFALRNLLPANPVKSYNPFFRLSVSVPLWQDDGVIDRINKIIRVSCLAACGTGTK